MWDYFEVTGTLSVSNIFTFQAFQPIFLSKTTFKYQSQNHAWRWLAGLIFLPLKVLTQIVNLPPILSLPLPASLFKF